MKKTLFYHAGTRERESEKSASRVHQEESVRPVRADGSRLQREEGVVCWKTVTETPPRLQPHVGHDASDVVPLVRSFLVNNSHRSAI